MNITMPHVIIFLLSVFLFFSLFYRLSTKERRMEKTLALLTINTPEDDDDGEDETDNKTGLHKIYEDYYNTKFIQANLRITYGEFKTYLVSILVVSVISMLVLSVLLSPFFAVLFSVFIAFVLRKLPDFIIENKKHKRKLAINSQKSDILSIMSSCSSSQMSLERTFKVLSERLPTPVNEIFYEAYAKMKAGYSAEDVLKYLKKVFDSNDFNFLLNSYEIWLQYQGSLQDTYRVVSISIRDKEEIDLNMAGLSSKANSTLFVLVGISLFFVGLSLFMIPDIFIPYAKSLLGQICIILSLFVLAWGVYKVNKLKNSIKY